MGQERREVSFHKRCRIATVTERLVTALVVDAFLVWVVLEGGTGRNFREQYPAAGHVAVWLGLVACVIGTWIYLKSAGNKTDRDIRRTWIIVSFFAAVFVVLGQDREPSTVSIAFGLLLMFALGKVMHHES